MAGYDSTLKGAQVVEAIERIGHLNVGMVDASMEVEEVIPNDYKAYVDKQIGDINALLDNINGEVV